MSDTGTTPLGQQIAPCGPVIDDTASARLYDRLSQAAEDQDWRPMLDRAWPALEPVFAASPYLASLVKRHPRRLAETLNADPQTRLAQILSGVEALSGTLDEVKNPLRAAKAETHLLCALCDLGGVWGLDSVTSALSRLADSATRTALSVIGNDLRERGRLISTPGDAGGPIPGLFVLAMGKHGANELNYSSDIDLSLFFDPDSLAPAVAEGVEMQGLVDRTAQSLSRLLSERTADGYVFRVDLRLRPDPASTPPVVATPRALHYYESVGQNWERAAFIKARAIAGDIPAAALFLAELTPFIWRRSLDYQAILDIQSIKRQIHAHKTGEGLAAAGANLKLGRGGIREIEFYAQTQQLILGGRDPALRAIRTEDALDALSVGGHIPADVSVALKAAYRRLRGLEHRVQMIEDEQTHSLPLDDTARARVAALSGQSDLVAFDKDVETLLASVNHQYGLLFDNTEDLSSSWGSLVFTGTDNDPETLATLERMGFAEPAPVCDTIRGWHHGRINATRTPRGRELFTRLAPRLLTALAQTGAPDAAFRRFGVFFSGLSSGVQIQALFLNQPELFDTIVGVMAFAPRLAHTLGRYPAALDSILDARFHTEVGVNTGLFDQMASEATEAGDFEGAMNAVRRLWREQSFRIGMQTLTGRIGPNAAGRAFTNLADAAMRTLSEAALAETVRQGGDFPGAVAVIALGKAGSQEMTAASDLDLMTVYTAPPDATSSIKGWSADMFNGRFTQRLISALSAHTAEGGLYEVDMRLRPSGSKGPVSVRMSAFEAYYETEAATWEFMALTRARVVWSSDAAFAARATTAIETALRRPRPDVDVAADIRSMRDLMRRERRATGFWDLKLSDGGLVDAEFVGQYHQLMAAPKGLPLSISTREQLANEPELALAWRLQQQLGQWFACAFNERPVPEDESDRFRQRLAAFVGEPDFSALVAHLRALRTTASRAFDTALPPAGKG